MPPGADRRRGQQRQPQDDQLIAGIGARERIRSIPRAQPAAGAGRSSISAWPARPRHWQLGRAAVCEQKLDTYALAPYEPINAGRRREAPGRLRRARTWLPMTSGGRLPPTERDYGAGPALFRSARWPTFRASRCCAIGNAALPGEKLPALLGAGASTARPPAVAPPASAMFQRLHRGLPVALAELLFLAVFGCAAAAPGAGMRCRSRRAAPGAGAAARRGARIPPLGERSAPTAAQRPGDGKCAVEPLQLPRCSTAWRYSSAKALAKHYDIRPSPGLGGRPGSARRDDLQGASPARRGDRAGHRAAWILTSLLGGRSRARLACWSAARRTAATCAPWAPGLAGLAGGSVQVGDVDSDRAAAAVSSKQLMRLDRA